MRFQLTRKVRIAALSLAALLILYAALGFLLVPKLVRTQIAQFTQQHYQREPTVGGVSFNPFTLALELRGVAFADSANARLLSFDRLLVNVDLSSVWRRGLSLHAVELDRPSVAVLVRADGSLNLSELGAPFAEPRPATPASAEPARVFIDRLQLAGGTIDFEDRARSTPFRAQLTPVSFDLRDFSTTGKTGNHYELQATSTAGERFRWSGNFGLAPLSSRGQFELGQVQARTLWTYLQESLGFEVASGTVDVRGDYQFAATEPQLTFTIGLSLIEVTQLGIRARGGADDWVQVPSLAVSGTRIDLARRAIDVTQLRVRNPRVVVDRGPDGTLNLLTLAGPASSAPTSAPPEESATAPVPSAWTVNAPDVAVQAMHVAVSDHFVKPSATYTLAPVNLALRGFSTEPGKPLALDADLTLDTGGAVMVKATGLPATRTFKSQIKLDALNLAALQPYVGTYTQMTLRSGLLAATLEAEVNADHWQLAGSLDSTKLHTVDNALREDFVRWEQLALDGIQYRSQPESLRIARITTRSPYVRLIIAPDQTTNVGQVLTMPGSAPGPVQSVRDTGQSATGRQQPMAVNIGRVQIQNGSANFADFWIKPNYAVSLQQLGGDISGLSSRKDSRATIALQGKIDRYAPVEIAGELNLLSASLFTDIRVKFDGVELTSVTPYSGRFAGYVIEKGKLSVDVRYQVENRQLNAEQRFVVDQLTLGERVDSPDAVKLPLRLAVALLKDRNGVIDLGLPVTGSLDDPKFRLGPIVWRAFVNLLAGVATSPFKLLGSVFGGGEEVNLIDFEPGSGTLDAAASEKLAALTKALHERPQLALEVPSIYSLDRDVAALGAQELDAKLQTLAQSRRKSADTDAGAGAEAALRLELLLTLYRAEKASAPLPPTVQALQAIRPRDRDAQAIAAANLELENALRPGVDALEPRLQALAQLRARNIQDALLGSGQVESARVFLLAPGAAPPSGDKVRVALTLK